MEREKLLSQEEMNEVKQLEIEKKMKGICY